MTAPAGGNRTYRALLPPAGIFVAPTTAGAWHRGRRSGWG